MSDHTLSENIEIIRTTGVKGVDVRTAIADAIEQTDDSMDTRIANIQNAIGTRDLFMTPQKISGTTNDYRLVVTNAT